ncbi:MAG TPA: Crp/Fnr family transcriptional regulator [Acidobacteriaceae bacterium]|nr:Crp/Fnr family transcriptional regulator [Acidobacteriaceae bacterium]
MGAHVTYPGRATIFDEGQTSTAIYVICSGHAKLSASSRDGRTMILKIAGPGDILGLGAMLESKPYELRAETLEHCAFKSIRRQEFLDFLDRFGEASRHSAQMLAKDYREAFLDARRLALSGSASGRLSQLLLDWARNASCQQPELRFTMALTHEELANMTGASRETITRLLNQLERDSIIERRGSTIVILNPDKLDSLIG